MPTQEKGGNLLFGIVFAEKCIKLYWDGLFPTPRSVWFFYGNHILIQLILFVSGVVTFVLVSTFNIASM